MGRFLSPDWSAKEDPVPYAVLDDPQSLNLYSYVRNSPLNRADADGHGYQGLIDFMDGASSAWASDSGAGELQEQQSTPGRAGAVVGHVIALAQGITEAEVGTGAAISGGTEAITTAPAALTGVGALAPAAGAAVAVAGAAVAVHGAHVAPNAILAMGGRSANDVKPDPKASEAHSVPKKDSKWNHHRIYDFQ